jgi:ABC-2 type transport system ATP-binding protein
MWETIRRLVREGATVLLTTQYLDEADQLTDRIAVIDRGRVIADGTADELKASVGGSSLHLTLVDRAQLEDARRIVGEFLGAEAQITPEAGRLTAPLRDAGMTADLLIRLREWEIAVDEITVSKPSLDEVFLAITGHPAEDDTSDTERSAA